MNIVEITNHTLATMRGIRRANESFNVAGCELSRLLYMMEGPRAEGFSVRFTDVTRQSAVIMRNGHDCAHVLRDSVNGQDRYLVAEYAMRASA